MRATEDPRARMIPNTNRVLLVEASSHLCSLPLTFVAETMRRQPLSPIADAPSFVSGLSVIRGSPTPVIDLAVLLQGGEIEPRRMLVTLRIEQRLVALAVDGVLGVRELGSQSVRELPPLIRTARPEMIEAIGVLDRQLLVVLAATQIIPDHAWASLIPTETLQ
jgi:purine-binding chemotaxis protein CheW